MVNVPQCRHHLYSYLLHLRHIARTKAGKVSCQMKNPTKFDFDLAFKTTCLSIFVCPALAAKLKLHEPPPIANHGGDKMDDTGSLQRPKRPNLLLGLQDLGLRGQVGDLQGEIPSRMLQQVHCSKCTCAQLATETRIFKVKAVCCPVKCRCLGCRDFHFDRFVELAWNLARGFCSSNSAEKI